MSKEDRSFAFREDFDDDVWDEEEWELFMQEADRKAEEYLKKFEEELLSRKEFPDTEDDHYGSFDEREEVRWDEEQWKESGTGWYDGEGEDSYRSLAVWKTAYQFASEAKRFAEQSNASKRSSVDFQTIIEHCLAISAKIAGGHSMGYDREVLEGNIAYCKRALKDSEECVDALERIRIDNHATKELLRLYGLAVQTRGEVRQWIEHLRRKIWWR
jgi:hypothetical protein